MINRRIKLVVPLLILTVCVHKMGLTQPPSRPWLIATGWDSPTPQRFAEEIKAFEKFGIFDGTTIRPTRQTTAGHTQALFAFTRDVWKWEEFVTSVEELKKAKPTISKANFLSIYANPGDVDWFDDAGWKEIVEHWRLLAKVAKLGGMKGLLFDAEPYTPPFQQFNYVSQPNHTKKTFEDYRIKARQRGREVMAATLMEFPEIMVFTYRLFSDMLPLAETGGLPFSLESNGYGLLPSFVDGWLDVAPDSFRMVEGNESIGYRANSDAEFTRAFTKLKRLMPLFSAPEHRELVRQKILVGHGIYLDAYVNASDNIWYIDHTNSTPTDRLKANVTSAMNASDGIVWLYGEKGRWWPGGAVQYKLWTDRLPNAAKNLRIAKDPQLYAREILSTASQKQNLLQNPSFSESVDNKTPAKWWTWQVQNGQGTFSVDAGQGRIDQASLGIFGQHIAVKPGQIFASLLRVKSTGRGVGYLEIGWKTSKDQWIPQRIRFDSNGIKDAIGWQEILGLIEVPELAATMIFMPSVSGQITQEDVVRFSEAKLVAVL
jgi:hypothetical protein